MYKGKGSKEEERMHITHIYDQEQSLNRRVRSTTDTTSGETYVMELDAHEQEITQVVITRWVRWSDELVANTVAINGMRFALVEKVLYIVVSDALANIIFGSGANTDISPIQSLSKRDGREREKKEGEGENVSKDTSSLSALLHDARQWQEHQWIEIFQEIVTLSNQIEILLLTQEQRVVELDNELGSLSKQIIALSQELTSSNSRQPLDGSTMHYLLEGAFHQLEQKVYSQLRSESDRHAQQVETQMNRSTEQVLKCISKVVSECIEPGEPPKPEGTFMRFALGDEVYEGYMKPVQVTVVEEEEEEEEEECW